MRRERYLQSNIDFLQKSSSVAVLFPLCAAPHSPFGSVHEVLLLAPVEFRRMKSSFERPPHKARDYIARKTSRRELATAKDGLQEDIESPEQGTKGSHWIRAKRDS